LAYAAKLTLAPKDVTEDDIKDLRDAGLTDVEILRVNLIASYFNFSNRVALGLGVELEKGKARTYKY
jgi:alkylhydroperoxidase family enzyme